MLYNRQRAEQWMEQFSIDAIIASTMVNVCYFSKYYLWTDPIFRKYMMTPGEASEMSLNHVLVPRQGKTALITGRFLEANTAETTVDEVYLVGQWPKHGDIEGIEVDPKHTSAGPPKQSCDTALAGLAHTVESRGLSDAKIAFDTEGLSDRQIDEIRQALPKAKLLAGDDLIRMIRMVKTPGEIALHEQACQIAEDAAFAAMADLKVGDQMQDVVRDYRSRIGAAGAQYDHFAFSIDGYGLATEPSYTLKQRDVMFVDWGVIHKNYFSDTGTTIMMHEPRDVDRRLHTAVRDALKSGQAKMSPGTRASQVQAAMEEAMTRHGVGGQSPHGHGIGLEVRDYPTIMTPSGLPIKDQCIDLDSDLPLETGMVLNLEAATAHPGHGLYHTEQSFVVTDTGCRPLIQQQRDEPIIGG